MFAPVRSPTKTHTTKNSYATKGQMTPPPLLSRTLCQTSSSHISQVCHPTPPPDWDTRPSICDGSVPWEAWGPRRGVAVIGGALDVCARTLTRWCDQRAVRGPLFVLGRGKDRGSNQDPRKHANAPCETAMGTQGGGGGGLIGC